MSINFIQAKDPAAARAERPVITTHMARVMMFVCIAALAVAGLGRLTGIGVQHVQRGAVVENRALLFQDAGQGVIAVVDDATGEIVHRFNPGEGGFLRTVMRGLAHDRMARGGDGRSPFSLTQRSNGHLIISDPMTGREVILDSFGKPNRDLFAKLLKGGGAMSAADATAAGAAKTEGERK
jgi:putative photosynthetic complex assembly protein